MAVTLQQPPKVEMLPLALVRESPSNPRKTFTGIDELAEDVKLRGILQPVLVRAAGSKEYELVFGARRYRAAKAAGMEAIPAFIRVLSDEETLEIQLVENSKRADIHPLEEAEGYHLLHEKYGHSVDEIAAKVGKSRSAVYQRLALRKLCPEGREAFLAGKLSASVAMVIAGLPIDLQPKALKDVAGDAHGDPLSYREALHHIESTYMLRLEDAPFDRTDAKLVAKAGACSACPKRTGNQRELFGDVKSPDVCTDQKCYEAKVDALWQIKSTAAKAAGQKVIEGKQASYIFNAYGELNYSHGTAFRDLRGEEWVGDKRKRIKQILGKDAPPPILARAPNGKIVELVAEETVRAAVKKLQPKERASSPGHFVDKQQQERERKHRARVAVVKAAMPLIVDKAEQDAGAATWRYIANEMLRRSFSDAARLAAKRRGFELKDGDRGSDVLGAKLHAQKDEHLRGLVVELIASRDATGGAYGGGYGAGFTEACKAYGVDVKKIEAQARKPAAPKKPAAKRPAAAAKPKKKK